MTKKPSITIVSDISLHLIAKKLESDFNSVELIYGDIVSNLNHLEFNTDFVIIFYDNFFTYRNLEDTKFLYEVIQSKIIRSNSIYLIPNQVKQEENSNLSKYCSNFYELDNLLNEIIISNPNLYCLDLSWTFANIGISNAYQFNLGHTYQMPYTKLAIKSIYELISNTISFLHQEEKKCIITDLDNTLWGGILGEDGEDKLAINLTHHGIIHYHYQLFLKEKLDEGFLLCICSKNNLKDVEQAFNKLNMPLKFEDFIIVKANWNEKVNNIKEIASELNIGTNSIIFIDDNAFEVDSVNLFLPEVSTFIFTNEYSNFLNIKSSFNFKRKRILKEDKEKNEQYKIEQRRRKIEESSINFEEYKKTLQIVIDVKINDKSNIERLAQMTEKTNQFNFNKEPFTSTQLENYMVNNKVYSLSVSDKFGDYGIVGLILIDINQDKVCLRNYLMSCRVLGKDIERQFLDYVISDLKKEGKEIKTFKFVKSEKNVPAENFIKKYNLAISNI